MDLKNLTDVPLQLRLKQCGRAVSGDGSAFGDGSVEGLPEGGVQTFPRGLQLPETGLPARQGRGRGTPRSIFRVRLQNEQDLGTGRHRQHPLLPLHRGSRHRLSQLQ